MVPRGGASTRCAGCGGVNCARIGRCCGGSKCAIRDRCGCTLWLIARNISHPYPFTSFSPPMKRPPMKRPTRKSPKRKSSRTCPTLNRPRSFPCHLLLFLVGVFFLVAYSLFRLLFFSRLFRLAFFSAPPESTASTTGADADHESKQSDLWISKHGRVSQQWSKLRTPHCGS